MKATLIHPFEPVFSKTSKMLILGTFPSVASRENKFYYGHPRNRFWQVLAAIYGEDAPETIDEKRAFLLARGLALWDVLRSCEIEGSGDASIRNPIPNDIAGLVEGSAVRKILCNGGTAYALFVRYCAATCRVSAVRLPSTSPANAAYGLEKLIEIWKTELKSDTAR